MCLLRRGATHGPSSRLQDGALTPEMEAAAMATADKLLGLSGSGGESDDEFLGAKTSASGVGRADPKVLEAVVEKLAAENPFMHAGNLFEVST